ncbi:common plant regulatory factor 1-like isoform X1 [Rosa rugosa]|uniref:common plant regulatory factor 1-like isoform X1 n=1 Tax=Rosa rugosa TaxID=74645 RepID=UPI002B406BFC|nr:common plant regulatory factor 1-like isoform X1 [Rosa rugosa]XP_062027600.1 common plant regulatory factor 1-like isoform X1 [Rosa rugosa]XP_062027601.1 common plant regulatory factor 1-like isoform X1 [Rosa rugosa]
MDQDVTKKFKGLDGHAVPIAYVSSKGNSGHPLLEASKSFEENKDGLTGGADGNTRADHHTQGKNGSDSVRTADNDVKDHPQVHPNNEGEINRNFTTSNDLVRVPIGSPYEKIATSTLFFSPSAGERLPLDVMVLDEKQLKREKRKQANRESARRSRMRKQAEYEELVKSCDALSTEQMDLKSELDQLKVDAEKMRLENAALREQLKNAQVMQEGGNASPKTEGDFTLPNDAKNILTNLGSVSSNAPPDCETHETSISETITRLHQLLESSSRTDAVAAR